MNSLKGAPAVAITGGLACGKSEVGRILRSGGVAVLEADELAHALLAPGQPGQAAVAQRYGAALLRADGAVDRAALARIVFADDAQRAWLNGLLHPAVLAACRQWTGRQRAAGRGSATIIPLLYEVGGSADWDRVLCVAAPPEAARMRMRARGWTGEEMDQRLAAQWPLEEKCRRADAVIWNRSTLADLERETWKVWHAITATIKTHAT